MTKNERLDWIDLSKGIGIILVVYGHVARGLDSAELGFEAFKQIDRAIYAFHMPLFFMLSGYFFVESAKKGAFLYIKSKMSTILYPYLIWSLIQIVIQFFMSKYTNGNINISEVFTFFLPRSQFWFLLALFFISMINIFAYLKFGIKGVIFTTILSIAYTFNQSDIKILSDILKNILFFNLGIFLFEYSFLKKYIINNTYTLLANSLIFVGLQYLLYLNLLDARIYKMILAVSGSLFVIQILNLKNMNFNHLKEIGNQSMIIYILHILVGSAIRIILAKFLQIDNVLIHIIFGVLFGIYVPFLMYKLGLIQKINFLFTFPIAATKTSSLPSTSKKLHEKQPN